MEGEPQPMPSKQPRTRLQCSSCGGNVVEGVYKVHQARCEILRLLRRYSDRVIGKKRQKRQIEKSESSCEEDEESSETWEKKEEASPESEDEAADKQQLQQAYHSYFRIQRELQQQSMLKTRQLCSFDIDDEKRQPCQFCGQQARHRVLHERFCPSRFNFCQFCSEQFTAESMEEHHKSCEERVQIKKIEMLLHDSSERSSSSDSDEEEDTEHRRARQDEIFEFNPYVRHQSQHHDPDFIYTHTPPIEGSPFYEIEVFGVHRPLYRYRRQHYPVQLQESVDHEREKRVTQSLTRFGYDLATLEGLKGHPKYNHYLRLIDEFMNDTDNDDPFTEGMNEYEISKLECTAYEPKEECEEEDMCAICYSVFEVDEDVMRLQCEHYFHQFCIRKWLSVNFHCPICKTAQVSRKISIKF